MMLYVGCYTRLDPFARGRADGIGVYRLDPDSGALTLVQVAPGSLNPTFLALDPARCHLYAISAVPSIDGHPGGAVSAYAVDPATGELAFLNRESCVGDGPAHVAVEASGRYVLVANYHGGSVAVLPIRPDGSLGPASDFVQHRGASVHPTRQSAPHAHSITPDPANRFALVCDLGLDRVLVYRLDLERGRLVPNDPPFAAARPGAGPRHLAFHPGGRHLYVINELDSTLAVYAYDAERGALAPGEVVSTLPAGFAGASSTAEVRVHPSGRLVFGSNRGHDSVAIFAVESEIEDEGENEDAGARLRLLGHEPTRGRTPRNFTLVGDGSLLLAANQDTDTIVAFRVDAASGRLTATGAVTASPSPVCLLPGPAGT